MSEAKATGKSTPLPWTVEDGIFVYGGDGSGILAGASTRHSDEQCEADAALIVEAVNAHDALIARNRKLERALTEIASDCDDCSRIDGVSMGEQRAWRAVKIKAKHALAENKEQSDEQN